MSKMISCINLVALVTLLLIGYVLGSKPTDAGTAHALKIQPTTTKTDICSTKEPPRPSNAPNKTICPAGEITTGTDVFEGDIKTMWDQTKKSGTGFAYIKATEGTTFVSSLFSFDWKATQRAGVLRGAYHFFHPGDDPRKQAALFLSTVGPLEKDDLPPMLDWEITDGKHKTEQIINAKIWLDIVQAATGKTPVIYVDPSFFNELGNPQEFANYPLFIAHYYVSCPSVPPPWNNWVFWQNGVGPVEGLTSQKADQDKFNGTFADLSSFANRHSFALLPLGSVHHISEHLLPLALLFYISPTQGITFLLENKVSLRRWMKCLME